MICSQSEKVLAEDKSTQKVSWKNKWDERKEREREREKLAFFLIKMQCYDQETKRKKNTRRQKQRAK